MFAQVVSRIGLSSRPRIGSLMHHLCVHVCVPTSVSKKGCKEVAGCSFCMHVCVPVADERTRSDLNTDEIAPTSKSISSKAPHSVIPGRLN